jgi:hypothetical protein
MLVNAEKMGERFKLLAIRKLDFEQPVPGFSKMCPQIYPQKNN